MYKMLKTIIVIIIIIIHILFIIVFNILYMINLKMDHTESLATDPEARVRFPVLPEKKSSGSGTGCTQPREYNWGATW
jgi:hypothetical protein